MSIPSQLLVLLGTFVGVTALAELLGAVNLGTAAGIGQVAFAAALVWVLMSDESGTPVDDK